jgi:hypothetical protein
MQTTRWWFAVAVVVVGQGCRGSRSPWIMDAAGRVRCRLMIGVGSRRRRRERRPSWSVFAATFVVVVVVVSHPWAASCVEVDGRGGFIVVGVGVSRARRVNSSEQSERAIERRHKPWQKEELTARNHCTKRNVPPPLPPPLPTPPPVRSMMP